MEAGEGRKTWRRNEWRMAEQAVSDRFKAFERSRNRRTNSDIHVPIHPIKMNYRPCKFEVQISNFNLKLGSQRSRFRGAHWKVLLVDSIHWIRSQALWTNL